jgi:hypothetical protein
VAYDELMSRTSISFRVGTLESAMKLRSVRYKIILGVFSIVFVLLDLFVGQPIGAQTQSAKSPVERHRLNLVIPQGTVLPVRLNHGLSSKNAKEGQAITARIMQDVPLLNHGIIPEGTAVLGTIVSVQRSASGTNGRVSFRFDALAIHQNRIPIVTNLRALAGFMEVQFAQTPEFTPGFGTPYVWANTRQVGGDEVYGVGGPVTDRWNQTVGRAVYDGVLVHVRAQSGSQCRGALDVEDRPQALWVFSSDACGAYGIEHLEIVHAGRTAPVGTIVLASQTQNVNLRSGDGLLLRVD